MLNTQKVETGLMKIAIAGMGVAGSYLASRLCDEHEIIGFERFSESSFDCICAWGTSKYGISPYVENCGLDFDDYIIHEGKTMHIKVGDIDSEIELNGLVTFDKHRLVTDMHKDTKIKYGVWVNNTDSEMLPVDHDILIDATGYRTLLPTPKDQILVPSLQFTVEYEENAPFDDFYIEIPKSLSGYLWYFPISKKRAHVGAGDVNHTHISALKKFFSKYPGRKIKIIGRPIRICPPSLCRPIFHNNIVGAGESIGAVFPLLGEGIIPSLQCSEILVHNIDDFRQYVKDVLREFQIYNLVFSYIKAGIEGDYVFPDHLIQFQEIIQHFMDNGPRYGYKTSIPGNLLKTIGSARIG